MIVDHINYRHGMIKNLSERNNLKFTRLTARDIPDEVLLLIKKNDLLSLNGQFGMKEGGDPTEYEELEIKSGDKTTNVEIFNKGMSMFLQETPELKRLFEVCCRLDRIGSKKDN
jgi:hypothetical protein